MAFARSIPLYRRIIFSFGGALLALCTCASASAQNGVPSGNGGMLTLDSSVDISFVEDDNIFETAADERSSQISVLTPSVLMTLRPSRQRFEFQYDGDFAWYGDSSSDDYDDHEIRAGAYLLLGRRSGLDLVGALADGHDDRGTGRTRGFTPDIAQFPSTPDEYSRSDFSASYTFGVSDTRAFLTFDAGTQELQYDNNREFTQRYDRTRTFGQATLGLRVGASTSLQLQLRGTDIEYDQPRAAADNLDSRESSYLLGVQWDATARTSGRLLVGEIEKEYTTSARRPFSGPNWEIAVRWSPRTYSHIDISTERFPRESNTIFGDFVDTTVHSVSWSHEWSERIESNFAISAAEEDFREGVESLVQDTEQLSAALGYLMRPWLRWEVSLTISSRDSNDMRFNFDRRIARIGARLSF